MANVSSIFHASFLSFNKPLPPYQNLKTEECFTSPQSTVTRLDQLPTSTRIEGLRITQEFLFQQKFLFSRPKTIAHEVELSATDLSVETCRKLMECFTSSSKAPFHSQRAPYIATCGASVLASSSRHDAEIRLRRHNSVDHPEYLAAAQRRHENKN